MKKQSKTTRKPLRNLSMDYAIILGNPSKITQKCQFVKI